MSKVDGKVIKVRITSADIDAAAVARRFQESIESGFCTLASVSQACRRQIEYQKAVGVSSAQVEAELAIYWLQLQRPAGFFARLRWLWQQLRALW